MKLLTHLVDILGPKWKHSDYQVRKAAIESLTNQFVLAYVAKTEIDASLRLNAATRLTDRALAQGVFADMAKGNGDPPWREALEKLVDQAALVDVAKNAHYRWVRLAAVDKLYEPTFLVEVACSASMSTEAWSQWSDYPDYVEDSGGRAVSLLVDQNLLGVVVRNARSESTRKAAAWKLTDQGVLGQVYRSSASNVYGYSIDLREAIIRNLKDQALLAEIAESNDYPRVRAAAVKNLTNLALVANIAKNDSDDDSYTRETAVQILSDQIVLASIAKNDRYKGMREAACKKLTDRAALVDVAKNGRYEDVRDDARTRLFHLGLP